MRRTKEQWHLAGLKNPMLGFKHCRCQNAHVCRGDGCSHGSYTTQCCLRRGKILVMLEDFNINSAELIARRSSIPRMTSGGGNAKVRCGRCAKDVRIMEN